MSALALAREGYDIDYALMRRLGTTDARAQLGQLYDLGLIRPRKARDDSAYRLAPGLPEPAVPPATAPGNGVRQRILTALSQVESASREELRQATGASRSGVTKALDDLIANGSAEPTAPPRSPGRRYRRK